MPQAVCGVRLVVHRGQELAIGVLRNEAADVPLGVLAGQLLATRSTFALGLPGAASPSQVLCQAIERLGIARGEGIFKHPALRHQHEGLSIGERAAVLGEVC